MTLIRRPRMSQARPVVQDAENFISNEVLSVPVTAGGTARAAVGAGTRHSYFQNIGSFDAIWCSGTPSAGNGFTLKAGAGFDYTGDPTALKFLGVGGTTTVFFSDFGEV